MTGGFAPTIQGGYLSLMQERYEHQITVDAPWHLVFTLGTDWDFYDGSDVYSLCGVPFMAGDLWLSQTRPPSETSRGFLYRGEMCFECIVLSPIYLPEGK